jgi:hypothetical protein
MARIDLGGGQSTRVLPWDEVSEVLSRFDQLDPFGDCKPFWTLEPTRWGQPLSAVVWGSKRHALVVPRLGCRVESSTEHVLGAFAPPPSLGGRRPDGRHLWTEGVAELHARLAYQATGTAIVPPFAWEPHDGDFPALKRLSISGPEALAHMPPDLGLHPFARVIEAEASPVNGPAGSSRLVAPDPGGDLSDLHGFPWHDAHSSTAAWISTDPLDIGATVVETLRAKAIDWVRPRFDKAPAGVIVDPLLVRDVGRSGGAYRDGAPQYIRSGVDEASALSEAARLLGARRTAELTGLPPSTARFIVSGRSPSTRTLRRAFGHLRELLGPDPLPRLLDLAADVVCAYPGCHLPARLRSRTCSERHRKALSRLHPGSVDG